MNTEKSQLRDRLRRLRLEMEPEEVVAKSHAIVERLKRTVDWSGVRNLHCFEPIRELNEVNVTPLVEFLAEEHPQITLYTFRKHNGEWRIVRMDGEKFDCAAVFDAVIVPMLGFDESLHRIGYGGGYYDRLLVAQPQARKIGVCFANSKVSRLPHEPHDVPTDIIITELR